MEGKLVVWVRGESGGMSCVHVLHRADKQTRKGFLEGSAAAIPRQVPTACMRPQNYWHVGQVTVERRKKEWRSVYQ